MCGELDIAKSDANVCLTLHWRAYDSMRVAGQRGIFGGGLAVDESSFQKKLADLLQEIGNLPEEARAKLVPKAESGKDRQEKLRKSVVTLQDSLDYLRLSIKYLLFDLEATRRENGYLRKMLEEQSGGSGT